MYQLRTMPQVTFEEVELSVHGPGHRMYVPGKRSIEPIEIDLGDFGGIKLEEGDTIVNIDASYSGAQFHFPELRLAGRQIDSSGTVWTCFCDYFKVVPDVGMVEKVLER